MSSALPFEKFPPPEQNVAPVAVMWQPPTNVSPLETGTNETPAPLAPFVLPVATHSAAKSRGLARRNLRPSCGDNTVKTKASTLFPSQQPRHPQPLLLLQHKPSGIMPTTTRGKPPPRLARVQDSLIIKITLPRSFLVRLRDEEELNRLLDRFASVPVARPVFLQSPQAHMSSPMHGNGGYVLNGATSMTAQGFSQPQRSPHGLPWSPLNNSPVIVLGVGAGGGELPSNELNTTRLPVAGHTGVTPTNKTLIPSPQTSTSTNNTLMKRPTSSSRVAYPSQHSHGIFSNTPRSYTQPAPKAAVSKTTLSRQSSGDSSATAATSASTDSILSHITVATQGEHVPVGWISRRSFGQRVASQQQNLSVQSQNALLPASDASIAKGTASTTQSRAFGTPSQATINAKKRTERAHPSTPPPRAKRVRSDSVLPRSSPDSVLPPSSSADNETDTSEEVPLNEMKRRQIKPRVVAELSDDDYGDGPLAVKKRQKTNNAAAAALQDDDEDNMPLMKRRSQRAKKVVPKVIEEVEDSDHDLDDLPISPEKRRQMRTVRLQAAKQTDAAAKGKKRIQPSPVKKPTTNITTSSASRSSSSTQPTSRTSSQEHEAMQAALRDELRTRGSVQQANRILGSSPVKKTKVPAAEKDIRDWIARKELMQIKPENFWYPIALQASTPGEWLQVESEEDLRNEIDKERKRELEAQQKSSPVKKPAPASSTVEKPVQTMPPLFGDLLPSFVLKTRVEQTEKTFADDLLFLEGLSTKVKDHPMGEAREVERAAQVWLRQFRRGRAYFEEVCVKQGLFAVETVETPVREFALSDDFDREIRIRLARREGRDLEEEDMIEKGMMEKGRKACPLDSIFDTESDGNHLKDDSEKPTVQERRDSAGQEQSENESEQKSSEKPEVADAAKKPEATKQRETTEEAISSTKSKKAERAEEQKMIKEEEAVKDQEIAKNAGVVGVANGVGVEKANAKALKIMEPEKSKEQSNNSEPKKSPNARERVAQAKNIEQTKTTLSQKGTPGAPKQTVAAELKQAKETEKDKVTKKVAPKKPRVVIDLTDSVIDLTGED